MPDLATSPCPHLMQPLRAGALRLRNRIVMGSMHTRLEVADRAAERIRAFYRERALGEVAMIVTGGVAPNAEGRLDEESHVMAAGTHLDWHRACVDAVRDTPTLMCLQLLHAGRYARLADNVSASALKTRINRYAPRALTLAEVWRTVDDFARAAALARELGYHAVEIMGSEGYLLNQFTAPATNRRDDEFGGSFDNRVRLPLEIIRAVRRRVGPDFGIVYRISALDLVDDGMPGPETLRLAALVEAAGADLLSTGVGWHEALVPTIAQAVPRAAWAYAVRRLKAVVRLPVVASNRINTPELAEALLADGSADVVALARPLLADAEFARKARLGQADRINTCIACNQGCLDQIFGNGTATCLVNPRAGHELELRGQHATKRKRIAVVGGGAAGMSFAFEAAARGHQVTLFEREPQLGGQLLLARQVPGKDEFDETLRYWSHRLADSGVTLRLGCAPDAARLAAGEFDTVVLATGVRPRRIELPGIDHPKVMSYADVLLRRRPVGQRVAIVGAGGIGFDVAEFLLDEAAPRLDSFAAEFGLDLSAAAPGGLLAAPRELAARRQLTLLQRSPGRLGTKLALTTGWIRRDKLRRAGVELIGGARYERIDDQGLHIRCDGQPRLVAADTVVLCAGQESERALFDELSARAPQLELHLVGGAERAAELDAMRAVDQATRLALQV